MTTVEDKSQTDGELNALSPKGQDLLNTVTQVLEGRQVKTGVLLDKPQISIDSQEIVEVCRSLKDDPRTNFKTLLCMAAVDYKEYIQMVYFLLSMEKEYILAVKVDLPYDSPQLPTISGVWRAADWYEREAHDLFGVEFEGHPDPSPLLLYEGFEGYPGRKEFPFHEYDEY